MTENIKQYIKQWLIKAENDLLSAQRLIGIEPYILDTACFHCQQAIEKSLKAFLVYKGVKTIRTHSIDFLLRECSRFDAVFESIDVKNDTNTNKKIEIKGGCP